MNTLHSIAVTAVLLSAPVLQSSPQQPFTITIGVAEKISDSGAKITLDIALKNTSKANILIGRSIGNEEGEVAGYEIEASDQDGNIPPETKYQRVLQNKEPLTQPFVGSVIGLTLAPGEVSRDAMIVNKFYDLTKPGKYKIRVRRTDPTSKIAVKSNVMTITIAPNTSAHPCRLPAGQKCEDLLKQ